MNIEFLILILVWVVVGIGVCIDCQKTSKRELEKWIERKAKEFGVSEESIWRELENTH